MPFLKKVNQIRIGLEALESLVSEAALLHKKEGIRDPEVKKILDGLATNALPYAATMRTWLEDKETQIEELEFLTGGFRMEYGTVLQYKKFASMVKNPEVRDRFLAFGQEESIHARELTKYIYQFGGEPEYTFVAEREKDDWDSGRYLDFFIEQEHAAIHYYQKGEERFQDAEFCCLIGRLKLEEKDHLKKLEGMKEEFADKEIMVKVKSDFKWVDPFMGEPGDRAWTE